MEPERVVVTAYLLLLDSLSYTERAVFLLRECFDLDHDTIAEAIGKTSLICRKIFSRAKRKMSRSVITGEAESIQFNSTDGGRNGYQHILERFIHALVNGDIQTTLSLLSDQAMVISDGGGKVKVAPRPIVGKEHVARFLFGILADVQARYLTRLAEINGVPGLIMKGKEGFAHVVSFEYTGGKIGGIYYMANPEKLRHFHTVD